MNRFFLIFLILILNLPIFAKKNPPPPPPPKKPPAESFNWRGMRMQKNDGEFFARFVRAERLENGLICVDIVFNCGLDPRSVFAENIFLDGKPLDKNTHFFFNKRGNLVRFFAFSPKERVLIRAEKIKSFDGVLMKTFFSPCVVKNQEQSKSNEKIVQ